MYQLSVEDREYLSKLKPEDDIWSLDMLKVRTIKLLREQKIWTIDDLLQLEPVALMPIGGIEVDERDLLLAITNFLFNGAYDNLHG